MADLTIEDTVILWDCSRSMIRGDFRPSRLRVAERIIRIFIDTKLTIDPKDSISIVIYGSRTKKIAEFSSDPGYLKKSLDKFEIIGNSQVEDGIAFALQLLVKQIQRIGGKIQRILIITDDSLRENSERINKLAKLAQGLGVFIDTCQIGEPKNHHDNPLKKIAYATNAEYAFFKNLKALFKAAEGFASKKIIHETEDYFNPDKEKNKLPPLISEISVDLRRPNINEIRDMMHGKTDYKCQICYQNTCPTCHNPFYACGRFCPSCNRPIHLHCASIWAEKSNFPEKNVFRCPFCYFLLRIPKSVQRLMKANNGNSIKIIDESDMSNQKINMIRVPDNQIEFIDDACSYCNNIFTEGRKVFKCSSCNSYYHEDCLNKMYGDIKACRVCGGHIS